jgi:hypothetical protein
LTTLGINDTRLIPEALMTVLFGDPVNRQKFYRAMLEANDFAMDREWFQPIYEAELSERVENIGALGYIHNSGYLYPRQYGL